MPRYQYPSFQPPNLPTQGYDSNVIPRSIDQLFDYYMKIRELGLQESQGQRQSQLQSLQMRNIEEEMAQREGTISRQRGLDIAQLGVDPAAITPEAVSEAQRPATPISPVIRAIQGLLQRRQEEQAAGLQKTRADISETEAKARYYEKSGGIGGGGIYTPEQIEAVQSGAPEKLRTVFPSGVPASALRAGYAGQRIEATAEEREEQHEEKRKARYRNYVLDIEQRDPIIKELRKQEINIQQSDNLVSLTKEGNTVAANAMGMKMARGLGEVGVLTETDITKYVESGRLDRKAADKVRRWVKGKPSDATLDEIRQIASTLKDTYNTKIQPRYDKLIKNYAAIEKIPPKKLAEELGIDYGDAKAKAGKADPLGILQ